MANRRLKNAGRKKAVFGAEAAAILAAAGINAATQMAAAGINSAATKQAAKDQAAAVNASARQQAQAIKDQTARSKEYQEMSQEFISEQNAENRELQKDIQMQLQMLTGQQNVNDRLEASKIKVKAGGKTKKLGYPQSLLRGGNMPFKVTDGGGVVPVGLTPEGFELYEIVGNDHEHYHKTHKLKDGGKYKSGVGIKFADGNIVEGEGNQNTNQGELMLVTPNDAFFISKHNIAGFNPAKMVEEGLHPLEAYAIQERQKAIVGINDDGTKKAKYGKKKFLIGGTPSIYDYTKMSYPQVGIDTIGDTAVGIAYDIKNKDGIRSLKCGGKIRTKAAKGVRLTGLTGPNFRGFASYDFNQKPNIPKLDTNVNNKYTSRSERFSNFVNRNADIIGAGLNALGNIGGAWITSSANRRAANTLAGAYNKSADIMADAYRNLKTIDTNSLRKEDYAAAHVMPALQAPVSFADQQISGVDRKLQRRLRNAGRYSASSAAAQERMANADIEAQDEKNRIYSADQQQMQQIRQANTERINETARMNAYLDTQANQQYGQDYLKLLQYNNDIENQKILGSAGAISEGAINGASAISQGQTSSAQDWATALGNTGLTFSNTLSTMAKRRADFENTMLGATTDAQINQIARTGSRNEKAARLNAVRAAINSGKLSSEDEAKYRYYESLLLKSL